MNRRADPYATRSVYRRSRQMGIDTGRVTCHLTGRVRRVLYGVRDGGGGGDWAPFSVALGSVIGVSKLTSSDLERHG